MSKDPTLRHISIRSIRKNPPDYTKLGRALIQLAQAKAEAEAQAQQTGTADSSKLVVDSSTPVKSEGQT